jgi:hypothetical protein
MTNQTILIDLDAILDTRLGTVSRISQGAAAAVMNNGYWERDEDNFSKLSGGEILNDEYAELYRKRDVETLKRSALTRIVDVLGPVTKALQEKQAARVEVKDICLKINIAPYEVTVAEGDEIATAMRAYVAVNTIIEVVNIPLEKLTPDNLDALCDIYIFYDYNEWFKVHGNRLLEKPIPMMTIMVPMLMANKDSVTDNDLLDKDTGMAHDPFKLHQMILAEYIGVEFQPAFVFSVIH